MSTPAERPNLRPNASQASQYEGGSWDEDVFESDLDVASDLIDNYPVATDTDHENKEAISDGKTVEADTVRINHTKEELKAKNRFSKVFSRAKDAFVVSDGRWDEEPAPIHPQAFDEKDTWQDPFEKFVGPAGPVANLGERLAAPGLETEQPTDEAAETQSRRKAVAVKLAGAWATFTEFAEEIYDLPNHMETSDRRLLDDLEIKLYVDQLMDDHESGFDTWLQHAQTLENQADSFETDEIDSAEPGADQAAPTQARYTTHKASRRINPKNVAARAHMLANKARTPETKARLKKVAVVGVIGFVAVTAANLRRK